MLSITLTCDRCGCRYQTASEPERVREIIDGGGPHLCESCSPSDGLGPVFRIRSANESDVPAMLTIQNATFVNDVGLATMSRLVTNPDGFALVATAAGCPIFGYAAGQFVRPECFTVSTVVVSRARRRQGVGTAFVRILEAVAFRVSRQQPVVMSAVVADGVDGAAEFIRAIGGKTVSFDRKSGLWLYRWDIGNHP